MIQVNVEKKQGNYRKFSIDGHAEYAEAGQDRLEVEPRELESCPGELVHRS